MLQPKTMNIVAMALFGTLSIFVRGVELTSLEIAFWRGLIALAVLSLLRLATPRGQVPPLSGRQRLTMVLTGMAVGLNWALLFTAYNYTSVAVATLAYYFAPVLVMALSPLLFRERTTPWQLLCFFAATAGLVLVIAGGSSLTAGNLVGVGFGLGAACLYATVVLINKSCPGGTGLDRSIWQMAGSCLLLLVLVPLRGGFHVADCNVTSLVNLLVVGVIHTGLAYWLYFTSIRDLPGTQTAILSYIDPVVAIFVSTLFFQESVALSQWLGAILILGCTGLYQVLSIRRPAAAKGG